MKLKKKTSIQAKTLAFLLIFNLVIILLLWICQISIFDIYYEKAQIDSMDEIISSLENVNDENRALMLQEIAYKNEVCIGVLEDSNIVETYNTNLNGCAIGTKKV